MAEFFQQGPILGNQLQQDSLLCSYLERTVPQEIYQEWESDLVNMGQRVVSDIWQMALDAKDNEPILVPYDPWGVRLDQIKVSHGWQQLKNVSAQEGLIAIGYERKYGAFSRLYQFAKLYLFHPSSSVYTCPLAMTDGAARLIELYGDAHLKKAYQCLTSRNAQEFWTSGQWMTERTGGSDVSKSETKAHLDGQDYKLYGTKWFTSATTSEMTMTLARIIDPDGSFTSGSRGLSLFYLELKNDQGQLNNILIHRLKDKLGTRSVPTAELSLEGSKATLVGEKGKGVKTISVILNITRLYNSVCAVANMRRGIALAYDYAKRRQAFGKKLIDHPLHRETLENLEVEFYAGFHLVFYLIKVLGETETGNQDNMAVLRLLTPITKLYTAKQAMAVSSEILECFGGAGYVEDTNLPVILRDSQVLPIWEGTTNILSLDVLRVLEKENSLPLLFENIQKRLAGVDLSQLQPLVSKTVNSCSQLGDFTKEAMGKGPEFLQKNARHFAYSVARIFASSLLLEHAQWCIKNNKEATSAFSIVQKWHRKNFVIHLENSEGIF